MTVEEMVSGSFRVIAATVAAIDGTNIQLTDLSTKQRLVAAVTSDSTVRRVPANTDSKQLSSLVARLPRMEIAEIKPGEPVIVSFSPGEDQTRVTAIALIAGVEPMLRAAPKGRPLDIGSWDLNIFVGQ
jgi:hypothetical protein